MNSTILWIRCYILILCGSLLFSCKDDEVANELLQGTVFPIDCCNSSQSIEILEDSLKADEIKVFPAGIVVLDSDLTDQVHFPQTNDKVRSVELFQIRDEMGDIIFENYDFSQNDPDKGWDGTIDDNFVDGMFSITMHLRGVDGSLVRYTNSVCNIICSNGWMQYVSEGLDLNNCIFPHQHDGNGSFYNSEGFLPPSSRCEP